MDEEEQEMNAKLGLVFDQITDDMNIYLQEDGDIAISVHTIDFMNALLVQAIETAMESPEESGFTDDTAFGAAWVMSVYQAFHNAVEMKSMSKNVPDDISTLFGEEDE